MVRRQQHVGPQGGRLRRHQLRLLRRLDVAHKQRAGAINRLQPQHAAHGVGLARLGVVALGRVQHGETHAVPDPLLAAVAARGRAHGL